MWHNSIFNPGGVGALLVLYDMDVGLVMLRYPLILVAISLFANNLSHWPEKLQNVTKSYSNTGKIALGMAGVISYSSHKWRFAIGLTVALTF